jgi:periodic tryptophan protein 1
MLGGWPLCVEWLDFPAHGSTGKGASEGEPSGFGNYIAVGTMDPTIEIWDMDMLDPIYPTAMLGPAPGSLTDPIPKAKGTGKKKKKLLQTNSEHHVSSVTSLSWSGFHRNLLLSSSADATVKLWDLSRPTPQAAIRSWDNIHPNEKVLAVEWNKHKSGENKTVVLSAGERSVKVWDTRASEEALGTGKLGSDVEAIKWDPWTGMDFFVSSAGDVQEKLSGGLIVVPSSLWAGLAGERSHPRLRRPNALLASSARIRTRAPAQVHHLCTRRSGFRIGYQPAY